MSTKLGRLQRVELREAWQTEDGDFTNWLAQEENLVLLGDTLGLELELEGTEQGVGPFRADVLCKDTADGSWVLIENQLERTDHDHLGKLLTYAAGLEAVTVVWVARRFTDEHRAALDWLNEITGEAYNFFGLEIELWRIGDSAAAPKFNVVSQPNDWVKTRGGTGQFAPPTENERTWLEYWTQFMEFVAESGGVLRARKPLPQSWAVFSVGRQGFWLNAFTPAKERHISASLTIGGDNPQAAFEALAADREAIEREFGEPLEWVAPEGKKLRFASIVWYGADRTDRTQWPAQHQWLAEKLEKLHRVFAPRVKALNLGEGLEPDDDEGPGGEPG